MTKEVELLVSYIRNEIGYQGHVDVNEDLISAEVLDSFSIVSLAVFAQEQFGVEFDPGELNRENLGRVSTLVELIRTKQARNLD